MFEILVPVTGLNKANQAAFSEGLICPYKDHPYYALLHFNSDEGTFKKDRFSYEGMAGVKRARYRCKDCKQTFIYDFSKHDEFDRMYKAQCNLEASKL